MVLWWLQTFFCCFCCKKLLSITYKVVTHLDFRMGSFHIAQRVVSGSHCCKLLKCLGWMVIDLCLGIFWINGISNYRDNQNLSFCLIYYTFCYMYYSQWGVVVHSKLNMNERLKESVDSPSIKSFTNSTYCTGLRCVSVVILRHSAGRYVNPANQSIIVPVEMAPLHNLDSKFFFERISIFVSNRTCIPL